MRKEEDIVRDGGRVRVPVQLMDGAVARDAAIAARDEMVADLGEAWRSRQPAAEKTAADAAGALAEAEAELTSAWRR